MKQWVPKHDFNSVVERQHPVDVQIEPSPKPVKSNLDWDDDEIFDELLAAVPSGKAASDVHSPFQRSEVQTIQATRCCR